jgi:predicted MFS family arabinose efflux permease
MVMPLAATAGTFSAQALASKRGVRPVAVAALALTALGGLLFSQVSVDGSYLGDLFFGLIVLGPGVGAAFVAGSIASLTGVAERDAGLASGLNNAAFQIGGAVGVAVLSTVAVTAGAAPIDGYRAAFLAAIAFSALGVLAALTLLGGGWRSAFADGAPVRVGR